MRQTVITLIALALCLPVSRAHGDTLSLDSLSWLTGCWVSVGGEPGSGEYWTPLAGESLFGVSRTVRGGQTVAFEFMQIRRKADGLIELVAHPSGQDTSSFRLTATTGGKIVFEDPAHDFPQRIVYQTQGPDELLAWIEGEAEGEYSRVEFPMARSRHGSFCAESSDQTAMLAVAETWVARYNAGDSAGVADLYAADGYYASAHVLAHGRGQIEQYWARGIAAGGHLDYLRPLEIYVDGNLGYFLGKYQATNAGVTVDGRIVIVGKRQAGTWKIAVHETVVRDQPE